MSITRKARHELPAKKKTMSEKQTIEAGNSLPPPLGCVHDRLFKLSGKMVMGMNLPTEEDQRSFHRTTPKKERKAYIALCRRVEAQCIEWGKQVADIAREIPRV